ncbi:hypothetical protein [Roseibium sediminicola]|uniref:Uncharacterized protein n=1 Tax=Roseibium sediminicola TaxID=2933272 RepID=A0ABT0H0I5_9HYPH|nr:hypothetical protein [Roseibium sp. CAU 1639]MCK7615196.1 hypothetical protein [Roseibium sp. CAU 1639]
MTISPVQTHFIKPLLGVFKRPPGADETAYLKLLKEKLSRFDERDLAAAADHFAVNADSQTWPQLSACLRVCEEVRVKREATEKPNVPLPLEREVMRMPEDAALRILAAEGEALALKACDGDWIVSLVEFVQEHKRLPDDREAGQCRAVASSVNVRIEEHVAHAPEDHFVGRLIDGIHAKRKRVAAAMKDMLRQPVGE